MSGNPDIHILYGDPSIYKKVPARASKRTFKDACDQAIKEMTSHLGTAMPPAKKVKIFREQSETGQPPTTSMKNLRSSNDGDYLAFIPPLANIPTLGDMITRLQEDIEELKKEYEQKLSEHEQKLSEHENELVDLRAQQEDTLSWIVVGDTGSLDRIILRNLLDKSQMMAAHACGLGTNKKERSIYWRAQFNGIERREDCLYKARSLLQKSSLDKSIIQQLCGSEHILSILVEKSAIRDDGDKIAHENIKSMNPQHYKAAIGRPREDPGT